MLIRIPLSFSSPFYSPLHLNQHVLTPLSIFRQLLNWSLKFPRRHLDTQVSQKPLIHSLWKLTPFVILSLCQQLPSVYLLFHAMFQPHWTRKTWHLGIWYLKINNSETQFLVCFLNPALFKTFLSRVSSNSIFIFAQVKFHCTIWMSFFSSRIPSTVHWNVVLVSECMCLHIFCMWNLTTFHLP